MSNTPYDFEMNLVFSAAVESGTCGDITGSGKDGTVQDWNKNGFDIIGKWNNGEISLEKSYRGASGNTVYYNGYRMLDIYRNTETIQGTYSLSHNGKKNGNFSMGFGSRPDNSNLIGNPHFLPTIERLCVRNTQVKKDESIY